MLLGPSVSFAKTLILVNVYYDANYDETLNIYHSKFNYLSKTKNFILNLASSYFSRLWIYNKLWLASLNAVLGFKL